MRGDLALARAQIPGSLIDMEALRRQSRRLLWHLFSFETVFILYIFAGAYKTSSRFGHLFPVDPSKLFVAVSIMVGLVIIWREGIYRPGLYYLTFYLPFACWAALTTLWSPSHTFAKEEAIVIFFQNGWALVAGGFIIANRRIRVYRFVLLLAAFSAVVAADWISRYHSIFSYVNNNGEYHDTSRVFALGMIVSFTGFVFLKGMKIDRCVMVALFLLCAAALMTSGARSFTLIVFCVLCLPGLISTRFGRGKLLIHRSQPIMLLTVFGAIAGVAYLYAIGRLPWTLVRMLSLFGGQGGDLSGMLQNDRVSFYVSAIEFWTRAPFFGIGLGGFGPLMFQLDGRFYPHNVFLQILSELGLVGLVLFLPVIVIPLRRLSFARLWDEPVLFCVLMLTLNNFGYSLFSGDLSIGTWLAPAGMLLMRPLSNEIASRAAAQQASPIARFA
jgi:O-antigen ligase